MSGRGSNSSSSSSSSIAGGGGGGGGGGESIYHWIKEVPPVPVKEPMYHSKHDPLLPPYIGGSTFRGAAATKSFGSIGRETHVKTSEFLKAHEKTGVLQPAGIPAKFERKEESTSKPPVPRRSEAPLSLTGFSSSKDYVTSNAVEAMVRGAPKVAPRTGKYADPSSINWLKVKSFAKVPEYLEGIKKAQAEQTEYIQYLLDQRQMEEEAASGVRTRELTGGEREELISALKEKWDAVNTAYQRITFKKISTSSSSAGEVRFKENCEKTMDQLEKDIKRLSVKGPIFIVDDGSGGGEA